MSEIHKKEKVGVFFFYYFMHLIIAIRAALYINDIFVCKHFGYIHSDINECLSKGVITVF